MVRVRVFVAAFAVVVLALGVSASAATTAVTTSALPCATKKDFNRVAHGMTITRVTQLMHQTGRVTNRLQFRVNGFRWQDRVYRVCWPKFSSMSVDFRARPNKPFYEAGKIAFVHQATPPPPH